MAAATVTVCSFLRWCGLVALADETQANPCQLPASGGFPGFAIAATQATGVPLTLMGMSDADYLWTFLGAVTGVDPFRLEDEVMGLCEHPFTNGALFTYLDRMMAAGLRPGPPSPVAARVAEIAGLQEVLDQRGFVAVPATVRDLLDTAVGPVRGLVPRPRAAAAAGVVLLVHVPGAANTRERFAALVAARQGAGDHVIVAEATSAADVRDALELTGALVASWVKSEHHVTVVYVDGTAQRDEDVLSFPAGPDLPTSDLAAALDRVAPAARVSVQMVRAAFVDLGNRVAAGTRYAGEHDTRPGGDATASAANDK
jgi:hypothetical protein